MGNIWNIPLILYSPVSWLLLLLRMLNADEALDPTVSTLSNPGCAASAVMFPAAEPGLWFSSWTALGPGRRANGLRIGIVLRQIYDLNYKRLAMYGVKRDIGCSNFQGSQGFMYAGMKVEFIDDSKVG